MARLTIDDYLDEIVEDLMSEHLTDTELSILTKKANVITSVAKIKLEKESQEIEKQKLKIEQFNSLNKAGFVPQSLTNDLKASIGIEKALTE